MHPIIELKNVWKTYLAGDVHVVATKNVNLTIKKGDYVVILGPSGSGKSTMMNLVGALDVPSKGEILLDGKDIGKMSESELAQLRGKKIGFVFQQFNLIPSLTAVQNVELPMMFYGVSSAERLKRAKMLLELVGLGHRLHHLPTKLSGGEQQRVAIARALSNDPDVILADEPTGNLDSVTGASIMKMLAELHKKGKTIIMVTHDVDLVQHAERVVELKDGQIVKDRKIKS
ncbi:MAG TPA: ABC transporter ATP-binding protein [Candidatus Nanoarchaeia archaeon]|nr:ABC transporter ATP-binding protein [Candidatus Nanoarchaeia archaeon]